MTFDWVRLCPAAPASSSGKPTDVSSLNPSLDQYKLYTDMARIRASKARGLELFAYRIFGYNWIGSWAFALDPFRPFRRPRYKISGVVRQRKFTAVCRSPRSITTKIHNVLIDDEQTSNTWSGTPVGLPPQEALTGFINDTTDKLRPMNTHLGEFELFKPSFDCPSRELSWKSGYVLTTLSDAPQPAGLGHHEGSTFNMGWTSGTGFTVSNADVQYIASLERAASSQCLTKYGPGELNSLKPVPRKLSLTYNVSELRELPSALREQCALFVKSFRYFRNFSEHALRTDKILADQYLAYQFGWKLLLQDIKNLIKTPEAVAKQLNLLLDRNGLDQTFRHTFKGRDSSVTGNLSFGCEMFGGEMAVTRNGPYTNKWNIKTAVNYRLDFPRSDIPRLRSDLTVRLWGLDANPEDVYNIIPWTWLIDWFSGCGDYIALINYIDSDRSLVNWAFLTYTSVGNAALTATTRTTTTESYSCDRVGYTRSYDTTHTFTASLGWKYVKRISANSLGKLHGPDVALNSHQQSILGALFSKYS